MNASDVALTAVQLVVGIIAAPLLPGIIQRVKAQLQGRRGASIFQPYREVARLWSKTTFLPMGTSIVYRLAPVVVGAALLCALLVIAPAGSAAASPLGHDMIVLVGLLVLARFAVTLSAWDTESGFSLMGAARDLTIAVSIEALLLTTLVVAALPAGSTDLRDISTASQGFQTWSTSTRWCALIAFILVIIAETGRQPIDNPDTHLELTMIHEGPLLEYSGRDLAFLQWAAAARHWIVIALAADVFLPHGQEGPLRIVTFVMSALGIAVGLAVTETFFAKMRILRAPAFVASGLVIALIGFSSWFLRAAS